MMFFLLPLLNYDRKPEKSGEKVGEIGAKILNEHCDKM